MSSPPSPKKQKTVKVVKTLREAMTAMMNPWDKCIVKSCDSLARNESTIKFKLPDKNISRAEWLQNCGRTDLIGSKQYPKYFICAEHFRPDDFTPYNRFKLKPLAVPTVFKNGPEVIPIITSSASLKTYGNPPILPKPTGETGKALPSAAPQKFFILTPTEPNTLSTGGAGPLILAAPHLPQQILASQQKTAIASIPLRLSSVAPPGTSKSDKTTLESPPVAIDLPVPAQASSVRPIAPKPKAPGKMIISVPKALYKEYKEGRMTLEELTKRSKKPVNEADLARVKQIHSGGKVQIATNPPRRVVKASDLVFQEVTSTLSKAPEPVAIKTAPPLSEPPRPPRPLHQMEMDLNTPQISAQVHQVAPQLPIKAKGAAYNLQKWDIFIPKSFRDWPVPASVVFSAAMQLKQNYIEKFSGKERLEIETVLHMVGHYTSLCSNSRCHVRERVHFYLKKMQQELQITRELEAKKKRKRAALSAAKVEAPDGNEQNQHPEEQEAVMQMIKSEIIDEDEDNDSLHELPDLSDA